MINKNKSDVTLISIIPNLVGGEGHVIPYHNAVTKAVEILGWKHKVAYSGDSKGENLTNIPNNWNDTLNGLNLEEDANFLGKINKFFRVIILAQSIINYWQKEIINLSGKKIIFIERFIHFQLLALWLAILFLPKKDLGVWILYRRDTHNHKTRIIYKLINKLIQQQVGKENFRLLTDSELLSNSLSSYFEENVTVMPIPHTELINNKNDHKNDYILCWWAGPPREEKGWQIIKNLTQLRFNDANKFCLVAAKSAKLTSIQGGVKIELIEDNLNRLDYVEWLNKSDLILLPYCAEAYKERTSGIFTESIIGGKMMLVTQNSWMAEELFKYNLEKLVIDWGNIDNVFPYLEKLLKDDEIHHKISIMREKYINFHNVENYAIIMTHLLF